MKFTEIIPLIRLPKSLSSFDYKIPNELKNNIKIGKIVEIPWGNKNIQGVVLKLKNISQEPKLKSIKNISTTDFTFSEKQLEFARWIKGYYLSSLSSILKIMLITQPKRKMKVKDIFDDVIPAICPKIDEEAMMITEKPLVLSFWQEKYKYIAYKDLVEKFIKQNKQVLILCPTLFDINELTQYLIKKYKNQIAIISGKLNKSQGWNFHQKIKSNEIKIIIGTRQAIFADFKNLGLIIIDNEHDENFKQWDQNPRYDARTSAVQLSKIHKAKLIFSSLTPRIENYWQVQQKKFNYLKIGKKLNNKIKLINMRDEREGKNFSPLSNHLQDLIQNSLDKKEKILLFLNRKGGHTSLHCCDCDWLAQCPDCKIPLVSNLQIKKLNCNYCGFRQNNILRCPNCGGVNLKFQGLGIQKLKQEVKKIFPNANINELSMDNQNEINENFDILIATSFVFQNPKILETIKNIGIVLAETGLLLPDFRATEKNYQILMKLVALNKNILIQSSHQISDETISNSCDRHSILAVSKKDPNIFYKKEILHRKKLNYPPFKKIIKLICQHKNKKFIDNESEKIYQTLKQKFPTLNISSPISGHIQKVRGRFRNYIIIKTTLDFDFSKIKTAIPDENWLIDIEPENLF